MSKHKYTGIVCICISVLMVFSTIAIAFAYARGMITTDSSMLYEEKIFSNDKVHTLDIVVDEEDWQELLDNAQDKEYLSCSVIIDGEAVKNVGIRTKGNSSLSTMISSDSDRYSFKVEFDQYDSSQSYYGLDKLALNNIIQDNTYMKDYLSYRMMEEFGADAPLSSFISLSVNGENIGLYLGVEAIEESFLQRNYGTSYGALYKPDSMDMGGGKAGNNKKDADGQQNMPDMENLPDISEWTDSNGQFSPPDFGNGNGPPDVTAGNEQAADADGDSQQTDGESTIEENNPRGGGMGGMGGRNSTDVALIYTDDKVESYSHIFDNAKTDSNETDHERLIASIKQINEGENLEEAVNIEEVLRYFVVHNFVLNFDSYTGSMMHNYYLYEEDGKISMIAWDYNLAFGAFAMGGNSTSGLDNATTMANYAVDTPVSGAEMEDRPLLNQLLSNETYLAQYHELFQEFLDLYFGEDGKLAQIVTETSEMIAPYVENDPTAFCTYEEFQSGVSTLQEFCQLRADSVQGQLDGTIPSTTDGQTADHSALIDASHINIQSMGSQGGGFGNRGGNKQEDSDAQDRTEDTQDTTEGTAEKSTAPDAGTEGKTAAVQQSGNGQGFIPGRQRPNTNAETDTEQQVGENTPPSGANGASPGQNDGSGNDADTGTDGTDENTGQGQRQGMQMPSGDSAAQTAGNSTQAYILLGIAVLVLAGGLIFAKIFR